MAHTPTPGAKNARSFRAMAPRQAARCVQAELKAASRNKENVHDLTCNQFDPGRADGSTYMAL